MDSNNKRIAKNTLMLYFRMMLIMGVSLYTSRVVLEVLGVEDFGIYNVVGGVVVMFGFLNSAMVLSTQRFLNYEMGKNDSENVGRVFRASMTVHIGIAVLIFLLSEILGLWFLNSNLNIPAEKVVAANWVYQASILSFCINIIRVPYNASIIANEKMSFFAYISILEVILKLLIVYLLVLLNTNKLILYSILIAIVSLIILMCYKIYCNKKFSICRYSFEWDKELIKKITSFSGWTLFGQLSRVGINQGVDFTLNIYFGVAINAATGISNQVLGAIRGLVGNFQTAFNPQITKLYASGDQDQLHKLVNTSAKISFFLLYIISVPILLNTEFILSIWLVEVPEYTIVFCKVMIVYALIEALMSPLWMIVHATGNISIYQIVISIIYCFELLISVLFLYFGFKPQIVFIVRIFVNCIILTARLYYAKRLSGLPIRPFISTVLFRITMVVLITLPLPYIVTIFSTPLISFFISSLLFLFTMTIAVYTAGLTKNEKETVNMYLATFLQKIKNK